MSMPPSKRCGSPIAQRHNKTAALSKRNKVGGRDHATSGVKPPQQRFEAGYIARLRIDERLIVQLELAAIERSSQIGFELPLLDCARVHGRHKVAGYPPALFFGLI